MVHTADSKPRTLLQSQVKIVNWRTYGYRLFWVNGSAYYFAFWADIVHNPVDQLVLIYHVAHSTCGITNQSPDQKGPLGDQHRTPPHGYSASLIGSRDAVVKPTKRGGSRKFGLSREFAKSSHKEAHFHSESTWFFGFAGSGVSTATREG